MKEYYKDPKLTASVLKNGYYRTGDLATVDEEGFIYIVGRVKNFIKSGGHRISPYEIQEAIHEMGLQTPCVVVGIPDELFGEAVVALVQTDTPSAEMAAKILTHCKKTLPSYKVPRRVFFIEVLPMNANGKVDLPKTREYCLQQYLMKK